MTDQHNYADGEYILLSANHCNTKNIVETLFILKNYIIIIASLSKCAHVLEQQVKTRRSLIMETQIIF